MCGICGILRGEPLDDTDRLKLSAMKNAMLHRGPDGEGEQVAGQVGIGMRRLSIIDVAGAWQPLFNEDRSLAIVANGEIYNYIELREQLAARGHTFSTHGDIETVLHLYEDEGDACMHRLRGMYAFALHDRKRNRVLIVRDRLGEKPLYYKAEKRKLVFASELKALLPGLNEQPALDPAAVDLFFHFGYVPEPRTALAGIRKLPAGHLLAIDLQPWKIEEREYWKMEDAPPLDGDPVEAIRAELDQISELVVRSDVPVGIALSGGLDSSALAVLAAAKYPGTLQAFSVGYPGRPPNDEREDAKALADHLGIPFHDIEIAEADMVRFFPSLVSWLDDPIADPASYGYYAISRLARERGVPVLLQGQGGDELFWGYSWVQKSARKALRKLKLLAASEKLRKESASPWNGLRRLLGRAKPHDVDAAEFQKFDLGNPDAVPFLDAVADFRIASEHATGIFADDFLRSVPARNAFQPFTVQQPWRDVPVMVTRLIMQTYLQENGIAQGDRLSMASSVELRLPFLDYRLVEIVTGLRKSQPDHKLPAKSWLRDALKDIVPDWVMQRQKKGFAPPVFAWYDALLKAHGANLPDGFLVQRGVLKKETALELSRGKWLTDGIVTLPFKALVLEMWCRKILAGGA